MGRSCRTKEETCFCVLLADAYKPGKRAVLPERCQVLYTLLTDRGRMQWGMVCTPCKIWRETCTTRMPASVTETSTPVAA